MAADTIQSVSMKRTDEGTPILSWCMICRNAEETLEATLKSIRERCPQSEIVIVDTMSRDSSPEIAKKYADVWIEWKGPNGDWDRDMPWFTDAAAARQLSFESASGRWRAWIDTDDRLAGPQEAEKLLKLNARWEPNGKTVVRAEEKPVGLEDLLLQLEKKVPNADCVWAPYLYCRDANGAALVWQERERIVRWTNPPKWRWAEKAHEILVPIEGYVPSVKVDFSHLLFVHERKFDDASVLYSTKRHFEVLHRQYQENDRTTRRCLYLAAYARTLCGEREREFIDAAHACATTATDRYRAMSALAEMFVRQGLFVDALEAFGSAIQLRPDLPDAWFQGAEAWMRAEDFSRAIDWMEKGIACRCGGSESYTNPRFHAIRYPTLLSEAYEKLAKLQVQSGLHEQAQVSLGRAVEILVKVAAHPAIGEDVLEAESRRLRMHNAYLAQANAVVFKRYADYLIQNDEPKKALEVLPNVPWNLQDHPLIVDLERKLRPVREHIADPEKYKKFYASDGETGYMESPDVWLTEEHAIARVKWVAAWLNKNAPNASVLDVGCFDGIVGIPLLKLCPGIKYVGIDIYEKPVARFRDRLEKLGMSFRATIFQVDDITNLNHAGEKGRAFPSAPFDVALWFEVIEHVPNPGYYLEKIRRFVKQNAPIFITTPWGSFDAGHPPEKTTLGTPRDSRGHLRVLTARDMANVAEAAGVEIDDLYKEPAPCNTFGDGLHAQVSNRMADHTLTPAIFAVPGALWDWNGRTVETSGMGASEKSIVQIGSALAYDYRRVEVYGPVPNEDIWRGVRYWPKAQLRHVRAGKIIVSRSPGFARVLDEHILQQPLKKILWLQDAYYPDLSAQVACDYETIVVVSEWHKKAMAEYHGVPENKMRVIYNPIDARLYTGAVKPERKRDRFIYCSSPDRGLLPLLRLWPDILSELPEATLDIYYGWRGCERLGMGGDATWVKRYETARREFEQIRWQKGVTVYDMVNPRALADAFLSAGVWAYPVDKFNETCCTAVLEARAAGCVPVCPPLAALAETAKCPQGFFTPEVGGLGWKSDFLNACTQATKVSDADRMAMAEEAIETYRIEKILPAWKELLDP